MITLTKINVNPEYKCKAILELSKIIKQTLKGQSLEILADQILISKMEDYESTAKAKTGGLICLPIKISYESSWENKLMKIILNHYMKRVYHTKFKMIYLIFLELKIGDLPGRDLKEGK